ncbi:alpha-amylase family glycosyl hydrolase [Leekyejoonella antrihumi]|uniref:DUF3459 domain-containing protein n=1 Tax=Leekyejoonella antrihumi TaxID=1660198 RepID=A0A563E9D8_9MICO|nr:alpha-amylase family glycosyl hydrolase [Leekyejoonella antrihumi]TWP38939.1 DUF3459 domain-containing protein [Leekyejoonella antrihumi]
MTTPSWVADSLWWQVYPLGALGADTTGQDRGARHTLRDLAAWLDYAVELGTNGIALGPIFRSMTHGYDTTDYFTIDERLGTLSDFDALIEECHRRGLRVMLDGVFNHVGKEHPAFQEVLTQGSPASRCDWFDLTWPTGDQPGAVPAYRSFEGHDSLITLNHDEPAVRDLVVDVMCHWLDRGADAWRLDAAYAVPVGFWSLVLSRVRERHPDVYVMGEVLHGDYSEFVTSSGVDAVTQYELWKAIWSSVNDRNLFELDHALGRHNTLVESFLPWTFVGNHDVTRLATQLTQPEHLAHALVVLTTVGGTPAVYYGDEQAFEGLKEERFGGDDAIRPALPDRPEELAPDGWPVYRLHQELIALRRRHRWLTYATVEQLHLTNEQLVYRSAYDDNSLVVALSLADDEVTVPTPGGTRLLAGSADLAGAGEGASAHLQPHGWAIFGTN